MARPAAALLAAIAVLTGARCGGVKFGHTLDSKSAAQQIAQNLATTTGLSAPRVQCPGGIRAAKDQHFDCATSLDGQPLVIHVDLMDDKGHFTTHPGAAIMVLVNVEKAIKAQVDQQVASDSTVRCGSHKVLVKQPGATFSCTVVTSPVSRTVEVTVTDVQGTFQFGQTGPVTAARP